MAMRLIIRGKKLVTVGQHGTIENGAMVIEQGKIIDIGKWDEIQKSTQVTKLQIVQITSLPQVL